MITPKKYPPHLSLLLFACLLFSSAVSAQGDLQLMPKRIVFEGAKRFQELNLANVGKDSARYTISVIQYRMKENGQFAEVTSPDPGQNFANKNFRVFPRSVTLAPNESQSIKVQLTNTSGLSAGEYRSHLSFKAIPRQGALGEVNKSKDTTGISVRINTIFGFSIPVIIRVGESTVKTTLSNPSVSTQNNIATLKITLNRTGNMSTYGHLIAKHISPQGKVTPVGIAKGLAVYTPNLVRHFQLKLDQSKSVDYNSGKIEISYVSPEDTKPETFAETVVALH